MFLRERDWLWLQVTGMQGDQSSGYLKVSSCLKHYAVYSQETSRQSFPAVVTEQDMEDTCEDTHEAALLRFRFPSLSLCCVCVCVCVCVSNRIFCALRRPPSVPGWS